MSAAVPAPRPPPRADPARAAQDVVIAGEPFDFDTMSRAIETLRARQLFFIGGSPKSGTTWLQLLLNAHPDICCGGEGHFMDRLMPALRKSVAAYNKTIKAKNETIFGQADRQPLLQNRHLLFLTAAAIGMMLNRMPGADTARVVGEKTPDNVRSFALLASLFPRAKFIHMVRDGRDCAVSAWFHNLRLNSARTTESFPTFDAFALHFARIWAGVATQGAHFATRHPGLCLTVRYEDLHAAPSRPLDALCRFLGASCDGDVLAACLRKTEFSTLSDGRERGQEDRGSFFRRGMRGEWREHFSAETERAFRAAAGPWMTRFGYAEASLAAVGA